MVFFSLSFPSCPYRGSEHDAASSGFVMQPSIGNGVTAFSSSSITQINSHIDPITNQLCVQTATQGDGVCTEGAEDWDSADCGTPPAPSPTATVPQPLSLLTTTAQNNGSNGNMFDVQASKTVV